MISTSKLSEMYNKWGDEQNLQPLGCALEEVMGNAKLSETNRKWLFRFIEVWEYAQDKEDLLLGDQIAMKSSKSNVTVIEDDDPRYVEDENLKHKMNLKSYFNAKVRNER